MKAAILPCCHAAILPFALAIGLLIAPAARGDVADYLGKPVTTVTLQIEGRDVVDPMVLQLVETRPGAAFSMVDVRESITHLFSLGRFEDVRIHADAAGSGVAVLYDLVPIHPVDRLEFTGASGPGIDVGRLRTAVMERGGASPPVGRAGALAQVAADELRQRGYLHARVTPRAELQHDPDRATLVFAVEPGARTIIGRIDTVGRPGVTPEALRKTLRIATGSAYERDAIDARVDVYLQDRRAKGFVAATLTIGTTFADGDQTVDLSLNADEGPRVRLVFEGDPLPPDRRDGLVPIAREASADEDLLEDSTNRIEEYFRAQGYRDASAPHTRTQTADDLVITFAVKRGPQYRVGRFEIEGAGPEALAQWQAALRLREGEPFAEARLDADVGVIQDWYRKQGFASARVQSAVEPMPAPPDSVLVVARILVNEGPRTLVGSVKIDGAPEAPGALLGQLGLQSGRPFVPAQAALDRDAIEQYYANLGYQTATVEVAPGLNADGTRADVVFTLRPGPQLRVDHVLIVGNVRTKTATIERELHIKAGDPLGVSVVTDGQRRLTELGLFRRARITQVAHGEEARRDLLVTVEEAPPTTIGYGGGVEAGPDLQTEAGSPVAVQHIQFAPRAFFEVGRRNLFGGTRSANFFTSVSLHPSTGSTTSVDPTASVGYTFTEYRLLGTYREPHVFGTPAAAFLTAVVEQQRRASFDFTRRGFNGEVDRRLTPRVSLSGSYQIQRTEIFNNRIAPGDKLLVDRLFPQVLISSLSSAIVQDTRDDSLNPAAGGDLSANVQLATHWLGSEVGLLKAYLTAQRFRTLPHANQTILAVSARVGMATGFPLTDLPASERFFAGGATTVRGFALDQLGTPETIDSDGFPIGGNGLVILNAELRAPLRGSLGVVGFVDGGNVFARTTDINFADMRASVGFGLRYKSPVGPIRVDLGFKLGRRDIVPGRLEPLTALHISLGQAF